MYFFFSSITILHILPLDRLNYCPVYPWIANYLHVYPRMANQIGDLPQRYKPITRFSPKIPNNPSDLPQKYKPITWVTQKCQTTSVIYPRIGRKSAGSGCWLSISSVQNQSNRPSHPQSRKTNQMTKTFIAFFCREKEIGTFCMGSCCCHFV